MSFFYNIGKSTIGSNICKIVYRPLLTSLSRANRSYYVRAASIRRYLSQLDSYSEFNAWFASALATASKCKKHAPKTSLHSSQCTLRLGIQARVSYTLIGCRHEHTATPKIERPHTREELLALVDQYDTSSDSLLEPPKPRESGPGPRFGVSDNAEDYGWPTRRFQWPPRCTEELLAIERLQDAVEARDSDPRDLYELYRALPAPRVPYLSANTRHKLLFHLGVLELKDEPAMLRYMSVIDDMQATGIPLTLQEWNCATSFAGRYVCRTTEVELEAALRLWKEMEHNHCIRADSITFSILFDTATKAGKFELAEMIFIEMENRGCAFNRFHYVGLIHYYGLRRDGEGVRKAYKALVEAGEIVDTVVLNCTISSLIRAYEPQAAQQVYERMKRLHGERQGAPLPPRGFRKKQEVTRALMKMTGLAKRDPSKLATFQNSACVAPDVRTYRILIQYFSVHYGDLENVAMLVNDMRFFGVQTDGSIFLYLLKGFATHGGIRYSPWGADRLESVWKAFLEGIDAQVEGMYIGKSMVFWGLRAFSRCSGKTRTLEVWEDIQERWKPESDDLVFATQTLRSLI